MLDIRYCGCDDPGCPWLHNPLELHYDNDKSVGDNTTIVNNKSIIKSIVFKILCSIGRHNFVGNTGRCRHCNYWSLTEFISAKHWRS